MGATLLIAAHGTVSTAGSATTRALAAAVGAERPGLRVELCFLDVAAPTLAAALDSIEGPVVVVPLLLSAGYHVTTDIPAVVASRPGVLVAQHLGPDPLIIEAVAERLDDARGSLPIGSTALAVVGSSRSSAHDEAQAAGWLLSHRLGREVTILPVGTDTRTALEALIPPVEVGVYLLAEGTFLDQLRSAAGDHAVVAEPIGVHPALVRLILDRYDATEALRR